MKAMILAAGRGSRMGDLTNHTPKPLLKVNGLSLIEHRIIALADAGIQDIIINLSYYAEQIQALLGNGSQYGVHITYSIENEPLETGGGIKNVLPLLGDKPFIISNSDILCDYDYSTLKNKALNGAAGHLILINNPEHNTAGDFSIVDNECLMLDGDAQLTYAGIALLTPALFEDIDQKAFPLLLPFKQAISQHALTGEHYDGQWIDVGTPERLSIARG